MEHKAWSNTESDDEPDNNQPKHPRPVLPRGIIYRRQEISPAPVEREPERTEPEVAQGILPGVPETVPRPGVPPEQTVPPIAQEQSRYPQPPSVEAATRRSPEEDDDDDEEDENNDDAQTQQGPPAEPISYSETPPPQPTWVAETPFDAPNTPPIDPQVRAYSPPPPSYEQSATGYQQPAEDDASYHRASAGGGQPPRPPLPPEAAAALPDMPGSAEQRWPDEGLRYAPPVASHNAYLSYGASAPTNENVTKREFEDAQAAARRKLAAVSLTTLAIGWWLGRRKVGPLRQEVAALQRENTAQADRITLLERQQQGAAPSVEQPAAPGHAERPMMADFQPQPYEQSYRPSSQPVFEATASVAAATAPNRAPVPRANTQPASPMPNQEIPRIIGGDGQEIVLQEGQHYERSAGSYGAVLDGHNRVVQDAIEYGESFKGDQLPERIPTPFGTQDARFKGNGAVFAGGGGGGGTPQGTLAGGQVPTDHTLSAGSAAGESTNEEAQRLLEAPKQNPVIAALVSPWLWLAVGILMIAFFAAATI